MLIIRQAQQEQISLALFVERLKQYLVEKIMQKTAKLTKEQESQLGKNALKEAQSIGLESEDDIAAYADLCVASESGFASILKETDRDKNRNIESTDLNIAGYMGDNGQIPDIDDAILFAEQTFYPFSNPF